MPGSVNESFDGSPERHNHDSTDCVSPSTGPPGSVWTTRSSYGHNMPVRSMKPASKDNSILHALLPGARFQKHTKKILVHTSTSNETIRFNIGGTMFETYKSTLRGIPNCALACDNFLAKHYRPDERDYFFDRDPEIFHCILNYLRTGEMHLPTSVCGPVVKSELEFWGIEETEIEECCWSRYSTWSKALRELRQLEADRKKSMLQWDVPELPHRTQGWRRFKEDAWKFFSNPSSSTGAQVYGYFAILLIGVSIFCFCARTHVDFQVEETRLVRVKHPRPSPSDGPSTSNETSMSSNSSSLSSNSSSFPSNESLVAPTFSPHFKEEIRMVLHPVLLYVDVSCFLFFAIELVARILVCPRKLRFLTTSMTLVEILALIPDFIVYACMMTDNQNVERVFEVMQLVRVLRIFRLMRQMPGLWILVYTLKSSVKDLLLLLLFLCTGTLIFSTLVYFAEKDAQDSFSSIPKCFWWSVITMTTVGYGDMYPITQWGYLIGTVTAISGLLMVGFTVPVLVNNFILYYNHTESHIQREKQREKSLKRSRMHLLTHAATELQQSGLGGGARRRKSPIGLNFGSFMVPISEDGERHGDANDGDDGGDCGGNVDNNNKYCHNDSGGNDGGDDVDENDEVFDDKVDNPAQVNHQNGHGVNSLSLDHNVHHTTGL